MFLLGLLSFFQISFIPGYLFLKLTRQELKGKIQTIVYSFALSMLINYMLVYSLTLLKIYKPVTVYGIIVLECILFLYLHFKSKKAEPRRINLRERLESLADSVKFYFTFHPVFSFFLVVAIIVFCFYFYYFFSHLGTVFRTPDAVSGYNRFALDWFNNRLPTRTWHYPQLVPSNWSISYIMMQNSTVQFFIKPVMALFPIMTLLLFLDLAFRKKDYVYLVGLYLYGKLMGHYYLPWFMVDGCVDVAVSFFSFFAIYAVILYSEKRKKDYKGLVMIALLTAAAAVTKQAGLFIAALVVIWFIITLFSPKNRFPIKKAVSMFLVLLIIMLSIVSWYLVKEVEIRQGKDKSEVDLVTQRIHKGRTYLQRLAHGISVLAKKYGVERLIFSAYALFLILSLFHRKSRYITLFFFFPFFIIWGLFYSYDYRNLTVMFPFVAYSSSFGALIFARGAGRLYKKLNPMRFVLDKNRLLIAAGAGLMAYGTVLHYFGPLKKGYYSLLAIFPIEPNWVPRTDFVSLLPLLLGTGICLFLPFVFQGLNAFLLKNRLKVLYVILLLLPLLLVLNSSVLPGPQLEAVQIEKQKAIGDRGLNYKLYDYHEKVGIKGQILTNYPYLRHLPEIGQYARSITATWSVRLMKQIAGDPTVHYFLMRKITPKQKRIKKEFNSRLKRGEYVIIFEHNVFQLVQVKR